MIQDELVEQTPSYRKKHKALLGFYLATIIIMLLNLFGLVVNFHEQVIFGIPASILWLLLSNGLFLSVTVIGYLCLFKPWAREFDQKHSN